ncbi:hypothetical protein [Ulvibacterium sp.]
MKVINNESTEFVDSRDQRIGVEVAKPYLKRVTSKSFALPS